MNRGASFGQPSLSVFFCIALWTCAASAETPPRPLFIADSVEGVTAPGRLDNMGDDWSIALVGDKKISVRGADFIALRRLDTPIPALPSMQHIILANGDRIPGEVVELAQDRLRIDAALGSKQPMRLPLDAVAAIWFQSGLRREDGDDSRFHRRLLAERRRRDVVLLKNGDVVEGSLLRLDAKALTVQTGPQKTVAIERDKVSAVAFNSDFMRPPRVKGPYARLVLANGCRLSLTLAQANAEALTGKTPFGVTVQVSIEQIVALDLLQGRAVYLSTLKPRSYEYTPFLGNEHLSFTVDGNWQEAELRLGGSTYDRGIGMHSKSKLVYELPVGCRRFEALVGIDDSAEQRASAAVEIIVDGKPRNAGWKNPLTKRDGPRVVRVELLGAKELTLIVDWGRQGLVQGRVNWANARLLK